MPHPIPLTVIGGYLGAGKTTMVNHLLRHADGRRIAVIVNDFGSLAIDADLLVGADAGDDVIALANGCVCCTFGNGLHEVLTDLTARSDPPDHVVIEVSGVADPTAAAAWGTVPPFEPGGVIVLADATQIIGMSRDRYVGTEIRRQLAGADLIAVTKTDMCDASRLETVDAWLDDTSGGAPRVEVIDGAIPADLVLGIRTERVAAASDSEDGHGHDDRYVTWSWASTQPTRIDRVEALLASLRPEILRLKGVVQLTDGRSVVVQCVGRHGEVRAAVGPVVVSQLVAIGLRADPPSTSPFAAHPG